MGYLVSWLEALPDIDEVQAVQPCSPGLLVRLMLHISSILGEHVFPTTSHDHLKGTGIISTPGFQDPRPRAPVAPSWRAGLLAVLGMVWYFSSLVSSGFSPRCLP